LGFFGMDIEKQEAKKRNAHSISSGHKKAKRGRQENAQARNRGDVYSPHKGTLEKEKTKETEQGVQKRGQTKCSKIF